MAGDKGRGETTLAKTNKNNGKRDKISFIVGKTVTLVSELLNYVHFKLKEGEEKEKLASICEAFYTDSEIKNAKLLLRDELATQLQAADCRIRTYGEKTANRVSLDLKEIIDVIVKLDTSNCDFKFLSENLNRIPPKDQDILDLILLSKKVKDLESTVKISVNLDAAINNVSRQLQTFYTRIDDIQKAEELLQPTHLLTEINEKLRKIDESNKVNAPAQQMSSQSYASAVSTTGDVNFTNKEQNTNTWKT